MSTPSLIKAYVQNGYIPRSIPLSWLHEIYLHEPTEFLPFNLEQATSLFDTLMDELVTSCRTPHIVPISGGWDSRLILAAVKERTDDITAWTLGNPGQLDYDIGSRVADAANINHVRVPLETLRLNWNDLCDVAHRSPWTYLLDAFFNRKGNEEAIRQIGGSVGTIWSGFLGDPLTGGHFRDEMANEDQSLARKRFTESERRIPSYLRGENACNPYPSYSNPCSSIIYEREFLDLAVRQKVCIAPIVLGGPWRGWNPKQGTYEAEWSVCAPFSDIRWASWWLHAPRIHHQDQTLYRQMSLERFPELFALPSKSSWGWPRDHRFPQFFTRLQQGVRNRLHRQFPWLPIRSGLTDNYLDLQKAFRRREDYRGVAFKAFRILKNRESVPWINLDMIWSEHDRGKKDNSKIIHILIGLAVNLEVHGSPTLYA